MSGYIPIKNMSPIVVAPFYIFGHLAFIFLLSTFASERIQLEWVQATKECVTTETISADITCGIWLPLKDRNFDLAEAGLNPGPCVLILCFTIWALRSWLIPSIIINNSTFLCFRVWLQTKMVSSNWKIPSKKSARQATVSTQIFLLGNISSRPILN